MKKETAEKIVQETELGYDLISDKFSQTRNHFWRGLEFIGGYIHENETVLDYGCGNGRLLDLIGDKHIQYYGLDVSQKLIDHAENKYAEENFKFSKINPVQTALAFNDEFFNTVYSIAVFHHFPSQRYREQVAKELFRVVKDGGTVAVTAWNLWPTFSASWQIRRGKQKKYYREIFRNWFNKLKGKSDLDWNDCEIPFVNNQGAKFERFHHAFTARELQKLFERAGFETELCKIVDGRNILYVGKK